MFCFFDPGFLSKLIHFLLETQQFCAKNKISFLANAFLKAKSRRRCVARASFSRALIANIRTTVLRERSIQFRLRRHRCTGSFLFFLYVYFYIDPNEYAESWDVWRQAPKSPAARQAEKSLFRLFLLPLTFERRDEAARYVRRMRHLSFWLYLSFYIG